MKKILISLCFASCAHPKLMQRRITFNEDGSVNPLTKWEEFKPNRDTTTQVRWVLPRDLKN